MDNQTEMSTWGNVLFLFLGWLLGLLSPVIVDEIKRRRDKRAIALGLRTELKELRFKLMGTVFILAMRLGTYNRELLLWLKPIAKEYTGLYPKDTILKAIESHLELTDEKLAALAAHGRLESLGGLSLKKYQLPLLEAKNEALTLFDEAFQNTVMEIRAQLSLLNEEIEQARFYFEKTYDSSLTKENYQAVCENLENSYQQVGTKARQIVDLIGKLPAV